MPLTFEKPPISEVVIGQVFAQRPDLLIPHFGEFWLRHKAAYPRVEHASAIVDEGSEPMIESATGVFLPRVWFRSEDLSRLIQLQQDRIFVNWRQVDGRHEHYPRFPALKAEFDRVANDFEQYVLGFTSQPVQHTRYELTYINIIDYDTVGISGPTDFGLVLKDCVWGSGSSRYLPAPNSCGSRMEFSVEPDINLVVHAGSAKRVASGQQCLRLEITAKQVSGESARTRDEWLEAAHIRVIESFKDLTTDAMHSDYWRLQK